MQNFIYSLNRNTTIQRPRNEKGRRFTTYLKAQLTSYPLLGSQNARTTFLRRPLTLVTFLKGRRARVVSAKVVKVFDLVNPDDPVLTSKCLLHRRELGSVGGQSHTTDTVDGLATLEKGTVVVVGHFVPVAS